jgi:hypothetical protein
LWCSILHPCRFNLIVNLGMIGRSFAQAFSRAQMMPVPRGAKIHLCVPETKKSHAISAMFSSSTPNPCTPSTITKIRSDSSRPALTSLIAFATCRTGSFSPLLERTQVMPIARVLGRRAVRTRLRIGIYDDMLQICRSCHSGKMVQNGLRLALSVTNHSGRMG